MIGHYVLDATFLGVPLSRIMEIIFGIPDNSGAPRDTIRMALQQTESKQVGSTENSVARCIIRRKLKYVQRGLVFIL